MLRVLLRVELNRETLTATVHFPRIHTAIDLLNVQRLPFFRLIVSIGTVSDLHYNAALNDYEPTIPALHGMSQTTTGAWQSTQTILPEQDMTASLGEPERTAMTAEITVLACVAVEFGNVGFTGEPVEVKYAGSAKVVAVG